jgi:hypothetical protein
MNVSLTDKLSVLPGIQQVVNLPRIGYYVSQILTNVKDYWIESGHLQTQHAHLTREMTIIQDELVKLRSHVLLIQQRCSAASDSDEQTFIALGKSCAEKVVTLTDQITQSEQVKDEHLQKINQVWANFSAKCQANASSLGDAVLRFLPIVGTIYSAVVWYQTAQRKLT